MNDIWTEISVLLLISYEITLKSYFFLFKIFLEIILFIISSSFPQNTIHNYANIGIGIGSVSANMKKTYISNLSDWPILRMGIIGIGSVSANMKKSLSVVHCIVFY